MDKQGELFPGENTWEFRLLIWSVAFLACLPLKPHQPFPVQTHVEEFRVKNLVLSLGLTVSVAWKKLLWLLGWSPLSCHQKASLKHHLRAHRKMQVQPGYLFASPQNTGSMFISHSSDIKSDRFTLLLHK